MPIVPVIIGSSNTPNGALIGGGLLMVGQGTLTAALGVGLIIAAGLETETAIGAVFAPETAAWGIGYITIGTIETGAGLTFFIQGLMGKNPNQKNPCP